MCGRACCCGQDTGADCSLFDFCGLQETEVAEAAAASGEVAVAETSEEDVAGAGAEEAGEEVRGRQALV